MEVVLLQVTFLVAFKRATNIAELKGYEDWDKVKDGMSCKEAAACCKGVTFDGDGYITHLEFIDLGLKGKGKAKQHINTERLHKRATYQQTYIPKNLHKWNITRDVKHD